MWDPGPGSYIYWVTIRLQWPDSGSILYQLDSLFSRIPDQCRPQSVTGSAKPCPAWEGLTLFPPIPDQFRPVPVHQCRERVKPSQCERLRVKPSQDGHGPQACQGELWTQEHCFLGTGGNRPKLLGKCGNERVAPSKLDRPPGRHTPASLVVTSVRSSRKDEVKPSQPLAL